MSRCSRVVELCLNLRLVIECRAVSSLWSRKGRGRGIILDLLDSGPSFNICVGRVCIIGIVIAIVVSVPVALVIVAIAVVIAVLITIVAIMIVT